MDGLDPDGGTTSYRNGSGSRHGVPLVFPLHVRRFHRRRSNGYPWRAETPLYRSDPDKETDIQSPLPQRKIPIVRAPSETSTTSANVPPTGLTSPFSPEPARKLTHSKATTFQSRQLVNPFIHFHGTRSSCVRHGRKSGLGMPKPSCQKATKDIFESSRSGAYIPVGFKAMKQMEATSPWAFGNSTTRCTELTHLTIEANKDDEDACPDCVAELGIKRREMEKAISDWSDTAFPDHGGAIGPTATPASRVVTTGEPFPALMPATLGVNDRPVRRESWRSITVEPADSESEAGLLTASSAFAPSTISNTTDILDPDDAVVRNRKRSRSVRFNDFSQEFEYDAEPGLLIVSRDPREDLNAVILERGGTVERVITNARDQNRTSETIAKISRELAQIANTLSSGQPNDQKTSDADRPAERTAVVDGNSDADAGLPSLETSGPKVLQLINEAANELQPGLIRKPTCEHVHGGHAWLDQSSANDFATEYKESFTPFDHPQTLEEADHIPETSAGERVANRQRLDEDYRVLKDHQLADTQYDHDLSFLKTHRRSLRSSTPLTASTFYISRRSYSPTQNLGSPEIPITVSAGEPVLPSHVFRSQDFLPVPPSTTSPRPLILGSPLIPNIRLEQGSPCIFTDSTAPSLTASAANSAQTTPRKETPKTPQTQQEPMKSPTAKEREKFWGSPSEVRANSQAIRHVMRMEKMSAVQEAAAMERAARRQKMVEGEVKMALE